MAIDLNRSARLYYKSGHASLSTLCVFYTLLCALYILALFDIYSRPDDIIKIQEKSRLYTHLSFIRVFAGMPSKTSGPSKSLSLSVCVNNRQTDGGGGSQKRNDTKRVYIYCEKEEKVTGHQCCIYYTILLRID